MRVVALLVNYIYLQSEKRGGPVTAVDGEYGLRVGFDTARVLEHSGTLVMDRRDWPLGTVGRVTRYGP
ncbi:MAG: hypothetical protein HZB13_18545 [Acidobacteria bacterium]|nr:hypothetical protein [Acidobacteriota bacterium]